MQPSQAYKGGVACLGVPIYLCLGYTPLKSVPVCLMGIAEDIQ